VPNYEEYTKTVVKELDGHSYVTHRHFDLAKMARDGLLVDMGRSAYIAAPEDGWCLVNSIAHLVRYENEAPSADYEESQSAVYQDFLALAQAHACADSQAHTEGLVRKTAANLGLGTSTLVDFLAHARLVKSSDYGGRVLSDGFPLFPRLIICPHGLAGSNRAHIAIAARSGDATRQKLTYYKAIKAMQRAADDIVEPVVHASAFVRPD